MRGPAAAQSIPTDNVHQIKNYSAQRQRRRQWRTYPEQLGSWTQRRQAKYTLIRAFSDAVGRIRSLYDNRIIAYVTRNPNSSRSYEFSLKLRQTHNNKTTHIRLVLTTLDLSPRHGDEVSSAQKCVDAFTTEWPRCAAFRYNNSTLCRLITPAVACRLAGFARLLVRAAGLGQSEAEPGSRYLPVSLAPVLCLQAAQLRDRTLYLAESRGETSQM